MGLYQTVLSRGTWWVILKFLVLLALVGFSSESCPLGWTDQPGRSSCYWIPPSSETSITFPEAVHKCNAKNASLMSCDNEAEYTFLRDTLLANYDDGETNEFWVGMFKENPQSGDLGSRRSGWRWLKFGNKTEPVSERLEKYWKDEEPTGDSSCVRVTKDGRWADRECDFNYRYICKIDNYVPTTTTLSTSSTTATTTTSSPTSTTTTSTTTSSTTKSTTTTSTSSPATTTTTTTIKNNDIGSKISSTLSTVRSSRLVTNPSTSTTVVSTKSIPVISVSSTASTTSTTTAQLPSGIVPVAKIPDKSDNAMQIVYIIIGVALFVIVIIILVGILVYLRHKRNSPNRNKSGDGTQNNNDNNNSTLGVPSFSYQDDSLSNGGPDHVSPVERKIKQAQSRGVALPVDGQSKTANKVKIEFTRSDSAESDDSSRQRSPRGGLFKKANEADADEEPKVETDNLPKKPAIKPKPMIPANKPKLPPQKSPSNDIIYETAENIHTEQPVSSSPPPSDGLYASVEVEQKPSTVSPARAATPEITADATYATIDRKRGKSVKFAMEDDAESVSSSSSSVPPPPPIGSPPSRDSTAWGDERSATESADDDSEAGLVPNEVYG